MKKLTLSLVLALAIAIVTSVIPAMAGGVGPCCR
jgi:hypothetical protein